MARTLPGADKYRVEEKRDAPWHDPLVVQANTEVSFVTLLNEHYKMHVPVDAEGWKTRCPLATEHDDGGIDRQFRVYASTNSGHCFALHGSMDPVRLWRLRSYHPTLKDAARSLLDAYGIESRAKPYWERMADLREPTPFQADPDVLAQTINVYLSAHPDYEDRQYDVNVLHHVNSVLSQIAPLCEQAQEIGEVEEWLRASKSRLSQALERPPGYPG